MNTKNNQRLNGIVFDMDGVIIDTCKLHEESWYEISKEYCFQWNENINFKSDVFGTSSADSARRLFGEQVINYDSSVMCLKKDKIYWELLHKSINDIVVNGFFEFLKYLTQSEIPVALATSSTCDEADFVLKNLGIKNCFKSIIHISKVRNPKPNPEAYDKACRELGVLPEECIAFEDSIPGIISLQKAGIRCVVVGTTLSHKSLINSGLSFISYIQDFTDISLKNICENGFYKPALMDIAL